MSKTNFSSFSVALSSQALQPEIMSGRGSSYGGGSFGGAQNGGGRYGSNNRSSFGGQNGGGKYGGGDRNGSGYGGGGGQNGYGGGNKFGGGNNNRFGGGGDKGGQPGSKLRAVDWNRVQLSDLKKNIYSESPKVASRNQFEVDQWLTNNQVTLSGHNIPRAVFEFDEAGYPKEITDLLYKNYQRPTTIQSISWPVGLSGLDMISIAKTGSGKTLGVSQN